MADTKISALPPVGAVDDTDEFVLARAGTTNKIAGQQLPGFEFDYAQITSNATSAATSDATATAIITGNSVTYDGSTVIIVTFSCSLAENPSGVALLLNLYDGSTDIGRLAYMGPSAGVLDAPIFRQVRLTPTAAAHTYSIRLWGGAGTKTVYAGAGGAGTYMPAFMRITKA